MPYQAALTGKKTSLAEAVNANCARGYCRCQSDTGRGVRGRGWSALPSAFDAHHACTVARLSVRGVGKRHPVKFSRTPAQVSAAAPILGQHTREVLSEMGYDSTQIDKLIKTQAVIAA